MGIQVALVEDSIRKDGSTVPRVLKRTAVSFEKVLEFMAKDTGLSANDMRTVFAQFVNALVFYLPEGDRLQTPVGTFSLRVHSLSAEGGASGGDPADPSVGPEGVSLSVRTDRSLLERLRIATSLEIVDTPSLLVPLVRRIENIDVGGPLTEAEPGQIIHVSGSRLSFDADDEEQGVFFVDTLTSQAARAEIYSRIGSTLVDCKVPELAAGEYLIEVRTRPTDVDIRSGAFKGPVIVS